MQPFAFVLSVVARPFGASGCQHCAVIPSHLLLRPWAATPAMALLYWPVASDGCGVVLMGDAVMHCSGQRPHTGGTGEYAGYIFASAVSEGLRLARHYGLPCCGLVGCLGGGRRFSALLSPCARASAHLG